MKKIFLLALAFSPLFGWTQSNNSTITGKVEQVKAAAKAYLQYNLAGNTILDSAEFNGNVFFFKHSVTDPVEAMILIDHTGLGLKKLDRNNLDFITLYLDKENIALAAKDSIKTATISGSKINDEDKRYTELLKKSDNAIAALRSEYTTADEVKKKDTVFLNGLQSRFEKMQAEKEVIQYAFINGNPDSYLSLLALIENAGNDIDVPKIEPAYKSLTTRLQHTTTGQSFAKSIESARATVIGAIAPDFTQNDVNDKPVKLTDFKGKYVLLDFWASWCGPCRAENPNVVKVYNTYNDKNFTVLGVSLDQPGRKASWQQAIEKDGLSWTQVSDLKFWDNGAAKLYGIRSIPQNYLIDPSGKIIAKNLRGDELDKKLASLLN